MQTIKQWRSIPERYRMEAVKCKKCQAIAFPKRLVCPDCGDREFEQVNLSGKGKLTTDPENHTGEGIFFTSRVFDYFRIASEDLAFAHADDRPHDVLVHLEQPESTGTTVFMVLSPTTDRTLASVFDAFTDAETLDFTKTVVPVRLALYEGDQLISRSQAKRIMNRVERFRHVLLDFDGVETVGRSFADEIFRVFARRHPQIEIQPINMNSLVQKEIERLLPPRSADPG